jgi:hypothetical protein
MGIRGWRIRIGYQAIDKMKGRVRELTNRNRGAALPTVVRELTEYLRGWMGYFGICEVTASRDGLDPWIRSRLRLLQLKQWIRGRTAYRRLIALGVPEPAAVYTARHLRRWWFAAHSSGAKTAMPPTYFDQLTLVIPSSPGAPAVGPDQIRPLPRAEYDQFVAFGAFATADAACDLARTAIVSSLPNIRLLPCLHIEFEAKNLRSVFHASQWRPHSAVGSWLKPEPCLALITRGGGQAPARVPSRTWRAEGLHRCPDSGAAICHMSRSRRCLIDAATVDCYRG